jgi:outer membrane protein assembly factor BamB
VPTPASYPIIINYDLSLQEMIEAGGYGKIYQPEVINQIAPSGHQGIKEVEIILVHLNQWIYSEEVLLLLKERNLQPATFEQLLVFGATYPNELREVDKVAALGSPVWGTFDGLSGRYDPYVAADGNIRYVAALWSSFSRWHPETRFAAVANVSGGDVANASRLIPTESTLTAPQVWRPVWTTTLEKPVQSLDTDGGLVVTDALFGVVHALETATGKVVWTYYLPVDLEGASTGSLQAVKIHDEMVFIGGPDQTVYTLRLWDGQLLWKCSLMKYPDVLSSLSLSVADDKVLVGSSSGFVAALDMKSGQVLWEFATRGQVSSVTSFYKKLVLAGAWEVYALDISTGSLVWSFDPRVAVPAKIALDGHTLYVASYKSVYALNAETGGVVWHAILGSRADFLKVGLGKVFVASRWLGTVYALDMTQGQILWTSSVEGRFGGGIELVGNELLVLGDLNTNNNIFVLNAETGEILRRWSNPRAWFFLSEGEMLFVNTATAVHLLRNSEAESIR